MNTIHPTGKQIKEFMNQPDDGPFVMINLLRFNDGSSGHAGETAYDSYTRKVAPMLQAVGGRLIWAGSVKGIFIGSTEDRWDRVMLVEYPSKKAFMDMTSTPEYLEAHKDREKGLETSVLLPSKTIFSGQRR